jgi:hypothetical protein
MRGRKTLSAAVEPRGHEHDIAEVWRQRTVGSEGEPAILNHLTIFQRTLAQLRGM